MRLGLDIQPLQSESADRGVGRYSKGLAEAIIRSGRTSPELILNSALSERFESAASWARSLVPEDQIAVFQGPTGIMGLIPDGLTNWRVASALYEAYVNRRALQILHTAAPFDGMGDDSVIANPFANIHPTLFRMGTVYDLIPFQEPEHYLADARYNAWFRHRLEMLKAYDLLLAISDYTRQIAIEFGGFNPDRVVAISTDTTSTFVNPKLNKQQSEDLLARYKISRPFIMHTGILEDRKNIKLLITAFSALPRTLVTAHQIVLVANTTQLQRVDMMRFTAQLGLPEDTIVFAGFVPDDDLAGLYSLTRGLVMPSKSEGFGLPLLEAMRCGAPALGANATSIPEVVGNRDFLFHPNNPGDLAEKLSKLLTDADFERHARQHASRQQACFSWDRSAARALDALKETYRYKQSVTDDTQIRYYPLPDSTDASLAYQTAMLETSLLDSDNSATGNISIATILTRSGAITQRQEAVMLNEPFALIFNEAHARLLCSSALAYAVSGYSALIAAQNAPAAVSAAEIASLPNCFYGHEGELSDEEATAKILTDLHNAGDEALEHLSRFIRQAPGGLDQKQAAQYAAAAAKNLLPQNSRHILYVDISELVQRDAKTGIQRVVRSILRFLLTDRPERRVEPIYRDGDHYRLARAFTTRFLDLPPLPLGDDYVTFKSGDIFLGLDLDALVSRSAIERLRRERLAGLKIVWVIYDILPELHPEWFDIHLSGAVRSWLKTITTEADHVVCISRAVADTVVEYVKQTRPRRGHPLKVSWWHLGADVSNSAPTKGISDVDRARIERIHTAHPIFLTVGTIEPRKGISKLVDGAEAFWASGGEGTFVIVGKPGWNVDPLIQKLRSHPETNQRLFWFEQISDEGLEHLYQKASAVLLPSEGEGFGLPLVEASYYNKPILARDIDVFREIGGANAFYFQGRSPEEFAWEVKAWLELWRNGTHPKPAFNGLTWQKSSDWLFHVVTNSEAYKEV